MSKEAIQDVVRELESLTESDQRLVLRFLVKLRRSRQSVSTSAAENHTALQNKNGFLVFTGQLEHPEIDWVQVVRDERDESLMSAALGMDD